MKRPFLCFWLLFFFTVGVIASPPTLSLVCQTTGQMTPLLAAATHGESPDACCDEKAVFTPDGTVTGYAFDKASCCELVVSAQGKTVAKAPVIGFLPLALLSEVPPSTRPDFCPAKIFSRLAQRQSAPRAPPLFDTPGRAPPRFS